MKPTLGETPNWGGYLEEILLSLERKGFCIAEKGPKIYVESFVPTGLIKTKILCLPGIGNYGWYFKPLSKFLNERGIIDVILRFPGEPFNW